MRQSNFELLRIFSIILVLIEHVNLVSTGIPDAADFESNPLITFIRVFTQCASMPAVGLFVMISGWFGIKSKVSGYCNLIFQVVFWYYSIAVVMLILSHLNYINYPLPLWKVIFPISQSNWFVLNYLVLMLLSPMLNQYIESQNKRKMTIITSLLMIANIYWGFIHKLPAFGNGYGFVFMICIYFIGRTLKLHYHTSIKKLGCVLMGGYF